MALNSVRISFEEATRRGKYLPFVHSDKQKKDELHSIEEKTRLAYRETMNMLLHLSLLPPNTYSKIYPWLQRRPELPPTVTKHRPYAEGKGFGSPVAMPEKKRRKEGGSSSDRGEDEEDAIPQVVFDRMIVRILVAVGSPMALGVGLIYLLGMLKEKGVWDVPMWFPFVTTLALFGSSALGIAYGTLSTSWDPEKKGSLLGWEEAKRNWPEMWKEGE